MRRRKEKHVLQCLDIRFKRLAIRGYIGVTSEGGGKAGECGNSKSSEDNISRKKGVITCVR